MFACDFETTTEVSFKKEGKVRVWAWQARGIYEDIVNQGTDIESFMKWGLSPTNKELFFHNLKFDGGFIIDWLMKNGWEHLGEEEKPRPRTFSTLITDMGLFFSIVIYTRKIGRKQLKVQIFDSLKKFPLTLERLARTFKMETLKGDIDYHKYREVGYEPNEEEWEYIDLDTKILARALKETFDEGLDKMTISSDAMHDYKSGFAKSTFINWFPKLDIVLDDFVRQSYKGGFVYVRPDRASVDFKQTTSYDVNSLFPYVMYSQELPYKKPVEFFGEYEKDDTYPLYIQKVLVDIKVKEGMIPTIQVKNNLRFVPTDYLLDTEGEDVELVLTNIDLELMKKHYDVISIEYLEGLKFQSTTGLFTEYIDKWSHVKATTTGGRRELSKLMLNSLYGKFGSGTRRMKKLPYLKDNKISYSISEVEITDPVYTAMASFITSYARRITITAAQDNYEEFIYADTDSVHLIGHIIPKNMEIHPTDLGKWDHEGNFGRSKFLRPKTYIKETLDGGLEITAAGMPESSRKEVSYENFKLGAVFHGKLSQNVVNGGVVLIDTDFTIHP